MLAGFVPARLDSTGHTVFKGKFDLFYYLLSGVTLQAGDFVRVELHNGVNLSYVFAIWEKPVTFAPTITLFI